MKRVLATILILFCSISTAQDVDPDVRVLVDGLKSEIRANAAKIKSLEARLESLTEKLIDAEVLESRFVGKWGVAQIKHSTIDYRRTGRSFGHHYIGSDGNVRLTTHPRDLRGLAVLKAPADSTTEASFVGWEEVPDPGNIPNRSGTRQIGLLELSDGLHFSYKAYYATTGTDYPTQGHTDGTVVNGLYKVSGAVSDRVGGYLGECPSDIGDYVAGFAGGPGTADQSKGPCLFGITFNPTLPQGDYLDSSTLLEYDTPHPAWNETFRCRGVAWIETEQFQGVLFTIRVGTGTTWYGEADSGPGGLIDRYGGGKGYHSDQYEQQVWVYDPGELRAVASGELGAGKPQPTIIPLTDYEEIDKRKGLVSASYRDGRLLIALEGGYKSPGQRYESQPLFLEFDFAGGLE